MWKMSLDFNMTYIALNISSLSNEMSTQEQVTKNKIIIKENNVIFNQNFQQHQIRLPSRETFQTKYALGLLIHISRP